MEQNLSPKVRFPDPNINYRHKDYRHILTYLVYTVHNYGDPNNADRGRSIIRVT
jgi:hypothetical protein